MTDRAQLDLLVKGGVDEWNASLSVRSTPIFFPDGRVLARIPVTPINLAGAELAGLDLQGAVLFGANLSQADLSGTNLSGCVLRQASLHGANLEGANLQGADLGYSDLSFTKLADADLSNAHLHTANLFETKASRCNFRQATMVRADLINSYMFAANLDLADLSGAQLRQSDLTRATLRGAKLTRSNLEKVDLYQTDLEGADLSLATFVKVLVGDSRLDGARVYGISAWDVDIDRRTTSQKGLVVTPEGHSPVTVDDIDMAQFVYLMLSNSNLTRIVDSMTSKAVLILGRFSTERKAVLDALRDALRELGYVSIVFDFDQPGHRDLDETVTLLGHMSRFIVADITDAKSIPQELKSIVPILPSVPIAPVLKAETSEYGMFKGFKRYNWVLPVHHYTDIDDLVRSLETDIVNPAERKRLEQLELLDD